MTYHGFVRVENEFALDVFYWFANNGIFARFPLALSPSLFEIFIDDVTPDQRILCIDYLSSVYGVVPYLYLS